MCCNDKRFTARSDRYCHDDDTDEEDIDDDADDELFHSFSSCSPRYSKVYLKFEELREVSHDCKLITVKKSVFVKCLTSKHIKSVFL